MKLLNKTQVEITIIIKRRRCRNTARINDCLPYEKTGVQIDRAGQYNFFKRRCRHIARGSIENY